MKWALLSVKCFKYFKWTHCWRIRPHTLYSCGVKEHTVSDLKGCTVEYITFTHHKRYFSQLFQFNGGFVHYNSLSSAAYWQTEMDISLVTFYIKKVMEPTPVRESNPPPMHKYPNNAKFHHVEIIHSQYDGLWWYLYFYLGFSVMEKNTRSTVNSLF